jgi:hypothetical protein
MIPLIKETTIGGGRIPQFPPDANDFNTKGNSTSVSSSSNLNATSIAAAGPVDVMML